MAHANRFTRMHENESVHEAPDSSSGGGFISGDNGMMNHFVVHWSFVANHDGYRVCFTVLI